MRCFLDSIKINVAFFDNLLILMILTADYKKQFKKPERVQKQREKWEKMEQAGETVKSWYKNEPGNKKRKINPSKKKKKEKMNKGRKDKKSTQKNKKKQKRSRKK